jgi:mitochondrial protein MBA1
MNTSAFSLLCRSSAHARLAGTRRAYATASASKPARPGNPPAHHRPVAAPTAKKFAKPGVSVGSTSPRNTVKVAKAQRASPIVQQQTPVSEEKSTPQVVATTTPTQDQPAAWEDKSIDEQMKELDQLMAMNQIFPTLDPWGQQMETLGVSIGLCTYYMCLF